jgi:hypothetical protein
MRFVETPIFTKIITRLDDEEYRSLQIALMLRPEQADHSWGWWAAEDAMGEAGVRQARWVASDLLLGSERARVLCSTPTRSTNRVI